MELTERIREETTADGLRVVIHPRRRLVVLQVVNILFLLLPLLFPILVLGEGTVDIGQLLGSFVLAIGCGVMAVGASWGAFGHEEIIVGRDAVSLVSALFGLRWVRAAIPLAQLDSFGVREFTYKKSGGGKIKRSICFTHGKGSDDTWMHFEEDEAQRIVQIIHIALPSIPAAPTHKS